MSRSAYLRPCFPAIHYPDNTGGSIGRGRFRPRGRPRATDTFACRRSGRPFGESPGGISPPGAPRTVREPLDSHGSRCSADDERRRTAWPCPRAPPVAGWLQVLAEQCSPFGPVPLQNLQPYYEPLRPCAPHRYSGPRSFSRLDFSLLIGTTGSHVYKSLIRLRAAYMPDAARAASRTAPERV